MPPSRLLSTLPALLLALPLLALPASAAPLHQQIDALLDAGLKGKPVSPPADDAEFLRRAHLDLAGTIPTAARARAFLDDTTPDKRARLIDELLASGDHPRRMADLFHVTLMERLGDHPEWQGYLLRSFRANKPLDTLAREIVRGSNEGDASGSPFFLAKRLENYGQNPVDYPALTRDVGRLFLGRDYQCAQCHDHLFVAEYKQADFHGLHAFLQHATLGDPKVPSVAERLLDRKLPFMSVFKKVPLETGPRLPGGRELNVPAFARGDEFAVKPDPRKRVPGVPKFSPLAELARGLPESPAFARNGANRAWALLMGRGLVHPLDLHHADNPPSHPALLDLLSREFAAHKYDLRYLLRELALTRAYQRSSRLPAGVAKFDPTLYGTAGEKRLLAEQVFRAAIEAAGERERLDAPAPADGKAPSPREQARAKFTKAFGGPAREPETEIAPSLESALFVLNDPLVLGWLAPRPGNLVARLDAEKDAGKLAEELYLSVLSRRPDAEERAEVARVLARTGRKRAVLLRDLAWGLLASTEFLVNH